MKMTEAQERAILGLFKLGYTHVSVYNFSEIRIASDLIISYTVISELSNTPIRFSAALLRNGDIVDVSKES